MHHLFAARTEREMLNNYSVDNPEAHIAGERAARRGHYDLAGRSVGGDDGGHVGVGDKSKRKALQRFSLKECCHMSAIWACSTSRTRGQPRLSLCSSR